MSKDPSPTSADVTVVTARLPHANVVFTGGASGWVLPPMPASGSGPLIPAPREEAADVTLSNGGVDGPLADIPTAVALPAGDRAGELVAAGSVVADAAGAGPSEERPGGFGLAGFAEGAGLAEGAGSAENRGQPGEPGPERSARVDEGRPDEPESAGFGEGGSAEGGSGEGGSAEGGEERPDGPLADWPVAAAEDTGAASEGLTEGGEEDGDGEAREVDAEVEGTSGGEDDGGRVDEGLTEGGEGGLSGVREKAEEAPRTARRRNDLRGIVVITGTDTDVGKTIVTAAIAAAAQASGLRVAVIKPGQTGIATGAPTDIDVINKLAGPDTARVLAEYPEPLAPLAAATFASMPPLELYETIDAIRAEADKHDLVLVEGAGGLLVPMGVRPSGDPWTVADLVTALGVPAIVVARAGLGTLNHTALTLEALERRGVPASVIIGAWPAEPELVHWSNLSELVPHLVGALPEGAGRMDPGVFRRSAPGWLTPTLYGVLDNWRTWAEESS